MKYDLSIKYAIALDRETLPKKGDFLGSKAVL